MKSCATVFTNPLKAGFFSALLPFLGSPPHSLPNFSKEESMLALSMTCLPLVWVKQIDENAGCLTDVSGLVPCPRNVRIQRSEPMTSCAFLSLHTDSLVLLLNDRSLISLVLLLAFCFIISFLLGS